MMQAHGRIVPVLLSGGTGSRLWALSRETYPKQLLSLLDDKTLQQQTVPRVADAASPLDTAAHPRLNVCAVFGIIDSAAKAPKKSRSIFNSRKLAKDQ
jgi:hypothetical protein